MSNESQKNSDKHVTPQQNGEKLLDLGTTSADALRGGFHSIATAYGDYTKKSFEDTKSLFEQLSSVKSFDRAIEVQTEFAKTASQTFFKESHRIAGLYGDLAKQTYDGFASKMPHSF